MTHRAPIEIVAYSPAWPERFAAEQSALAAIFPAPEIRIEHIGSTSVPGLAAKPVLDILIGALSLAQVEARGPRPCGRVFHAEERVGRAVWR